MKPVALHRNIDLKDEQNSLMKSSLKQLKKKVHRFEWTAQVRQETKEGETKQNQELDTILNSVKPKKLPTLKAIIKVHNVKNPLPIKLSNGEIVLTTKEKEAYRREQKSKTLSLKTLNALKEARSNRTYGITSYFGGKIEGQELKTIHDYEGLNTFDRGSRTLKRKKPFFHHLAVPPNLPWFHPGYYDNGNLHKKDKVDTLNFNRMTWRNKKGADEFREERKQIAEKNMKFFKKSLEDRGELPEEKSYAASIEINSVFKDLNEAELESLRSPFSRMSAKSTIGLVHPESRDQPIPRVNMLTRPSDALESMKPDKNNDLSSYDTIQHDGKYYFAEPIASTAKTLVKLHERMERRPKDFLRGSLDLQDELSEMIDDDDDDDDNDSKSRHSLEKSIKSSMSNAENKLGGLLENTNVIESNNNNNEFEGSIPVLDSRDIKNYIKHFRKTKQIFSPIKRNVLSDFLAAPPSDKDGDDITVVKSESVEQIVPSYLLMTDKEIEASTHLDEKDLIDYGLNHRSNSNISNEDDEENNSIVSQISITDQLMAEELDQDEKEWAEVIATQSAAAAFAALIF